MRIRVRVGEGFLQSQGPFQETLRGLQLNLYFPQAGCLLHYRSKLHFVKLRPVDFTIFRASLIIIQRIRLYNWQVKQINIYN